MATAGQKLGSLRHSENLTEDGIVRSATATYVITGANTSDTWANLASTSGLPLLGSLFADDTRLVCKRRTPRRHPKSKTVWEVQVEWSSNAKKKEDEDDLPPTERPPIIRGSSEIVTRPFVRDAIDGTKRVVASNGQEFSNTPLRAMYVDVMSYTRYESAFPQPTKSTYQGKVNDASLTFGETTYAKKTVLCAGIEYDNGTEIEGQFVWQVSYTFKFWPEDPDADGNGGWMREFLDQGTHYTDATTNELRHFIDDLGNPRTGNLDGSGDALATDEDPVFIWLNEYQTADFSGLNLT